MSLPPISSASTESSSVPTSVNSMQSAGTVGEYSSQPVTKPVSSFTSTPPRRLPPFKKLLPLIVAGLVVVAITIGLIASLIVSKKKQENRSQASADGGSTLQLLPASTPGVVGQTYTFSINITTDTDSVSAAELHISYDPAVLQVSEFVPGAGLPTVLEPATITNGALGVTLGAPPTTPLHGSGVLGTFKAKVLAAKATTITFANTTQVAAIGKTTNALKTKTGAQIALSAGATPTVGAPTNSPTTQPTVKPTSEVEPTEAPDPTAVPTHEPTQAPVPTAAPTTDPLAEVPPLGQAKPTKTPTAAAVPTYNPNLISLDAAGSQSIKVAIDAKPTEEVVPVADENELALAELSEQINSAETVPTPTPTQSSPSFFGGIAAAISNFFRSIQQLFK